jgi:hypothetical protein
MKMKYLPSRVSLRRRGHLPQKPVRRPSALALGRGGDCLSGGGTAGAADFGFESGFDTPDLSTV